MKPPVRRSSKRPPVLDTRNRDHAAGLPEDVTQEILLGLEPVEPPAHRKALLLEGIIRRVRDERAAEPSSPPGLVTIRGDAGEWHELAPGVHMKPLHHAGQARSFLVRLAAGATLPPHEHEADEECMVVEGEVFLGDVRVVAGDYHVAKGGSRHGIVRSPHGALLFIRSAAGVPHAP
jgi:quercetin dioxygenase-like cupin family protein